MQVSTQRVIRHVLVSGFLLATVPGMYRTGTISDADSLADTTYPGFIDKNRMFNQQNHCNKVKLG